MVFDFNLLSDVVRVDYSKYPNIWILLDIQFLPINVVVYINLLSICFFSSVSVPFFGINKYRLAFVNILV